MKRIRLFKLPDNPRFTNKAILLFLLPIFLEQVLINVMGIADSLMVARSQNGEIAMAGVEVIWYAMFLDWLMRGTIYIFRLKSNKWQKHKVI